MWCWFIAALALVGILTSEPKDKPKIVKDEKITTTQTDKK